MSAFVQSGQTTPKARRSPASGHSRRSSSSKPTPPTLLLSHSEHTRADHLRQASSKVARHPQGRSFAGSASPLLLPSPTTVRGGKAGRRRRESATKRTNLPVDLHAPRSSPRSPRAVVFEGDGNVKAAAVKKSVSAKIKAASYKCGGTTPRERLSKLFGKFVRSVGASFGAKGLTYPQMWCALRGVCRLQEQEFDMLWYLLDTDQSGIVTLQEFLGFLGRDDRSQDEFARVLSTARSMARDEFVRAVGSPLSANSSSSNSSSSSSSSSSGGGGGGGDGGDGGHENASSADAFYAPVSDNDAWVVGHSALQRHYKASAGTPKSPAACRSSGSSGGCGMCPGDFCVHVSGSPKHVFLRRKVTEPPAPMWVMDTPGVLYTGTIPRVGGRYDEDRTVRLAWNAPPLTSKSGCLAGYRVEWRVGALSNASGRTLDKAGKWVPLREDDIVSHMSSTEIIACLPEVDLRPIECKVRALDNGADWGNWSATLSVGLPSSKQAELRWMEEEIPRREAEERRRREEEEEFERQWRATEAAKKAALEGVEVTKPATEAKKHLRQLARAKKKAAVATLDRVMADVQAELLLRNPRPSEAQVAFLSEVGKRFVTHECPSEGSPVWWGVPADSPAPHVGPSPLSRNGNSASYVAGQIDDVHDDHNTHVHVSRRGSVVVTHASSGGRCQECEQTQVTTRNHGLECSNRGHWICWACMVGGIDWERALAEGPELFAAQEMQSRAFDEAKDWRDRLGGTF